MFKKTLLVGAIALAASGVALADGFYVGAGIGGTGFHDKLTFGDVGGTNDGKEDGGNLGFLGGLDAGYTFNFANQFNLGVEAFANATSAKIDIGTDADGTATIKQRYTYGLRAVPAYQVTPDTDIHALVGYVRGNFKLTDNGLINSDVSNTFNANGFQLGVGSSTNVAKNVAVRGDFVYSGYQSKTYTTTAGDTYKNQINTLDGIVSVQYKFG